MRTATADEIRTFVVEEILWEDVEDDLTGDTPLLSGVLDSFGLQSLIAFLEERYEITISDDELVAQNLESIDAIAAFVKRKRASG